MAEHSETSTLATSLGGTALVMLVFNAPLTTVAAISSDLRAGPSAQTWMIGAISLGLAAALLACGAMGDAFGRARVLSAGAVAIAAGGVVCACAEGPAMFVAARILQGVGGAAILACSLGLIGNAFPPGPRRHRATGAWGATLGAGIAAGPLVAAVLAQVSGWRSVYAAEAGLAVVVVVFGRRLCGTRPTVGKGSVDWIGVICIAAAQGGLVTAFVLGREGWGYALPWGCLAAGGVLLTLFGVRQRLGRQPLFDLGLLRRPGFIAALLGAIVTGLALVGPLSELPVVLQRGMMLSPVESSLVLGLWSGTSALIAWQARHFPGRDAPICQLGLALAVCAAGLAIAAVLALEASIWLFVPGLVLAGIGSGLAKASLARLAVETVPARDAAMGSGANNTVRYLGSSLGVAIVAAMLPSDAAPAHQLEGIRDGLFAASALAIVGAAGIVLLALFNRRSGTEVDPVGGVGRARSWIATAHVR